MKSYSIKISIFGPKNFEKIWSKIGTPKIDTFLKLWVHTKCVNLWRPTVYIYLAERHKICRILTSFNVVYINGHSSVTAWQRPRQKVLNWIIQLFLFTVERFNRFLMTISGKYLISKFESIIESRYGKRTSLSFG